MGNSGLEDHVLIFLRCQDITPGILDCNTGPGYCGLVLSLLLQFGVEGSIIPFLLFGNLVARLVSIRFAVEVQRHGPFSVDKTPLCLAHPIRR